MPADDKQNARLIVSQIILETLEGLKMRYPEVGEEKKKQLQAIRRRLSKYATLSRRPNRPSLRAGKGLRA